MSDTPSSYYFYLTADGVTRGFRIIADENGLLRYSTGLAPTLAPQQRLSADNLYEGQPPEVSVTYAAETWTGGAGHVDAPSTGQATEREASNGYNYTRGIDLSDEYRGYLSPKRNHLPPTSDSILDTDVALDGEPIEYLTTSLGTFVTTPNAVYRWDSTDDGWLLVDSAGSYRRGMCEFNAVVFVPRGDQPYRYTSTGTTWVDAATTDDNADCFCTRGDDGDASSPTLNVLVKLYDNAVSVNTDGTGASTQWTSPDTIGPTNEDAKWVLPADDALLVFKTQGIYRYDFLNVDDIWKAQYLKDDNAEHVFQWRNGLFYANYGDRLLEYDPIENTLEYVYPPDSATSPEIKGKITGIAGDDDNLYLTIENHSGNTYVMKGKPHGAWHTWAFPVGSQDFEARPNNADVYDFDGGTVVWGNPDGALGVSDYATATTGITEYLVCNDFGFNIPAEAEINGVEVSVERWAGATSAPAIVAYNSIGTAVASTNASFNISQNVSTMTPIAGDLMLVFVTATGSHGNWVSRSITPPSGWALVPGTDAGTPAGASSTLANLGGLYYKYAGSSEPSGYTWSATYTWGSAGTSRRIGISFGMVNLAGPSGAFLDAVSVPNFGDVTSGSTSHTTHTVNVADDDSLVLGFFGGYTSTNPLTYTTPTGMSALGAYTSGSGGYAASATFAENVNTGSYGPAASTSSGTVYANYSILVVIKPYLSPGFAADYQTYLWDVNGIMGTGLPEAQIWPTAPATQVLGSEVSLWGAQDILTPAVVNTSDFGIALTTAVIYQQANLRNVRMKVYATLPGQSRGSQALYVAGPGTIHAENPVVLSGYTDSSVSYILPRAGMRPEDDINYRYETDFGVDKAEAVGSWVDFGASAYPKFLNRGTFLGESITAGKPVTLDYETQDESGSLLTATQNGLSAENVDGVVVFHRVRYHLSTETTSDSTTPVLLGWTVQATLNPPRYRVWNMVVDTRPEGLLMGGGTDYLADPYDLEDFLYRATTQRVVLQDYRNRTFVTRLSDLQPLGLKHYKVGGDDRLAPVYQLQLIEISPISPTGIPLVYSSGAWGQGYEYRSS